MKNKIVLINAEHTFSCIFLKNLLKSFFFFIFKEEKESNKIKEKVINFRLYNLTVKLIPSASKHNLATLLRNTFQWLAVYVHVKDNCHWSVIIISPKFLPCIFLTFWQYIHPFNSFGLPLIAAFLAAPSYLLCEWAFP